MVLNNNHTSQNTGAMPQLAIGLMSGTSLDGVDAALVRTNGTDHYELLAASTYDYDAALRQQLSTIAQQDVPLNDILRIEQALTSAHAAAVKALLQQTNYSAADIQLIGFHGQTIRHLPDEGLTWQLGNAQQLAAQTDIQVVADFRRSDMAHGGQGAPLVPLFHQTLFHEQPKPLLVLNIGGVANMTYLGADGEIIAGDTGPGNGLLDSWVQQHSADSCDRDGTYSAAGQADTARISKWLSENEFFTKPMPRSADRYQFQNCDVTGMSLQDGAATLAQLTVDAVVQATQSCGVAPQSLILCGGGVHNPTMVRLFEQHFSTVQSATSLGVPADSLEAACFGWLAVRHAYNLPMTIPATTGCAQPVSGGVATTSSNTLAQEQANAA